MTSNIQTLKSKQGEVNYRSKLSIQYLGKKTFFPNEPNQKQIISAIEQRIASTKKDFDDLKKSGVRFSPYLEIGAELGHRAMLLESKYNAKGFAVDLSLESLCLANFFAKNLNLKKIPTRICADAYHLPFQDNSFNFIFCYQTLHHFPDPSPVVKEAFRVLAPGGYLFINEEPISQAFNLKLWRRPTKLRNWEKILKHILILPFISIIGKTETDHHILENTFSLKTWEKSFEPFDSVTAWVNSYPLGLESKIPKITTTNWLKPSILTRAFISFTGGGIKILAQKNFSSPYTYSIKKDNILSCPTCHKTLNSSLVCPACHTRYPAIKNIKLLLNKKLMAKLYPQLKNK